MINSILSTSLASARQQTTGDTTSLAGLATATAPLSDIVAAIVQTIAPASTLGTMVRTGRLEAAALSFAREARMLSIGGIDRQSGQIDQIISQALASGEAAAAALPEVGLSDVDRVTAALSTAAKIIGDTPAPSLVPSTGLGER